MRMATKPGIIPLISPTRMATTKPSPSILGESTRLGSKPFRAYASPGPPVSQQQTKHTPDQGDGQRLGKNEEKYSAVRVTDCFENGEFGSAFANRNGHGIPSDEEKSKEHDHADGDDQELDVAELLDPIGGKRRFRFRFGFVGGVGKFRINGLGDAHGVIGAVQFEDVPAHLTLDSCWNLFLEIVPLEPELSFVLLAEFAVVNADEIELPCAATIKSGLDGDAIPDLPMEALRGLGANDGALTVFQEGIPLVIRNDQFTENLALVFRVNDELREEILFVLVNAAKPVVVGDVFHAGDAEDFVAMSERDQIDDRSAVNNYQPIGAGDISAAAKGILDHGKERKKEQSDGERADGEKQANLFRERDWRR